jgi:hypothetical protein
MITHNLFEPIKPEKSFWERFRYNGSWTDDTAMELYNLYVREELANEKSPNERYLTYGDKDLEYFFKVLEKNKINTIELRRRINGNNSLDFVSEKKQREEKKENKKIESSLIQRISQLNKNGKFKKIIKKAEEAINNYDHPDDEGD